jgi:hypothetical protein
MAGIDHDESSVFAVADRAVDRSTVDAEQESDAAHG